MAASADPPAHPARPSRRRLVVLVSGAAVLAVAVLAGAAWRSRNAVGERLVVDYLARKGVPATLKLTRLDTGGVAGSLVVGPTGSPTLTVDRFEAEFAPGTVLARRPVLTRLLLVRPKLELRYDGRHLDFGALQPLVDEALRAPSGGAAGPDVRIEDGRLRLRTPYGAVLAEVAAELDRGRLRRADLRLQPGRLAAPAWEARALSGTLAARAVGADALALQARLAADAVTVAGATATHVTATSDGLLPYRPGARDPLAGRAVLKLTAAADRAEGRGNSARRPEAHLDAAGEVALHDGLRLDGTLRAGLAAPEMRTGPARLRGASLRLDLAQASWSAAEARLRGRAVLAAAGGELALGGERAGIGSASLAASGQLHGAGGRWAGRGVAQVDAPVSFGRAAAARLAARGAPGPYGADLRPALAHALERLTLQAPAVDWALDGGTWRVDLARPLTASGPAAGLALALTGAVAERDETLTGDLAATVRGGGLNTARLTLESVRMAGGRLTGAMAAKVDGSAGPLRDLAFASAGSVAFGPQGLSYTAQRCGDLALGRFLGDKGEPLAREVKARLCPVDGEPLLVARFGGWTFAGHAQALSLTAPPAKLAVQDATARLRLRGQGERLSGEADAVRAVVRDTDAPRRFNPLSVSGRARLARDVWTADMAVALARGQRPLGRMTLTQDMRSGAGGLHLDAPDRVFAPDGLQPAAVLPSLAALATEVSGHADVSLDLGWKGEATTASVNVATSDLQGKTVLGLAKGVKTDLHITGLDPLASLATRVTIDRLEAVVPLTDVSATYTLGKDQARVTDAQATLAGGRVTLDPLVVGLLPDSTLEGVVRARGVQLGALLDAVNLSRALQIQAELEGVLPFSLGPKGLRIADGRLAAMGPGRLTLKREALTGVAASGGEAVAVATGPGAAPVPAIPPPKTSAVQDFAFQALEDLAFSELSADVGSRQGGRLGVVFHVKGRHDPPQRREARVGLLDLLRGKAFDKPIPLPKGTEVNLTLDSSLNLDDLLTAYTGLSKAPGSAQVQP